MADSDLCFSNAAELSQLISARAVSPVELTHAILSRIDEMNPLLNAYTTVSADFAVDQARASEARALRGELLGPLDGIPCSLKDLEPTAGIRTTMGSKFFENYVPSEDGVLASRLKSAGAIVLGKTNTPHLGNLVGPPCRNPWNRACTPGGSSGGAAVAVAAGLGPLSTGSDGAGSIRLPAALCGVFGMKPSLGRVPRYPSADYWGRSHNGPITRTVRDAAVLLQVLAEVDERDPLSIGSTNEDYIAVCGGDLKGIRIAWSPSLCELPVDSEVQELSGAAASGFAELGANVEEVALGWPSVFDFHRTIYEVGTAARHSSRAMFRPDWIEPTLMEIIGRGKRVSAVEFARALTARSAFCDEVRKTFERYDLLLTPQCPIVAWSADPESTDGESAKYHQHTYTMLDRLSFCYPFNLTGHPAASVPCGFTRSGLPVAIQIVGGWRQDTLVLRAAASFEVLSPWSQHKPYLA